MKKRMILSSLAACALYCSVVCGMENGDYLNEAYKITESIQQKINELTESSYGDFSSLIIDFRGVFGEVCSKHGLEVGDFLTGYRESLIDTCMYDNAVWEVRKVLYEAHSALTNAVKEKLEEEKKLKKKKDEVKKNNNLLRSMKKSVFPSTNSPENSEEEKKEESSSNKSDSESEEDISASKPISTLKKHEKLKKKDFEEDYKSDGSSDDNAVAVAVAKWRRMKNSLLKKELREVSHGLLKNDIRKKWLDDSISQAILNVIREKNSKIFNDFKTAHSKADASTLLAGENIEEGTASYFAWLEVVDSYLKDRGCLKKILDDGEEFSALKKTRESLNEKCDELNECLEGVKSEAGDLDYKQRINLTIRSEIIQDGLKEIKKEISDKLSPSKLFEANEGLEMMKVVTDFLEKEGKEVKPKPVNKVELHKEQNAKAERMLQLQVVNIEGIIEDCGNNNKKVNDIKKKLEDIKSEKGHFWNRQNKMNQLIGEIFSFKQSPKNSENDNEPNEENIINEEDGPIAKTPGDE